MAFNFNNDMSDDRVSPPGAPRLAANAAPEAPAIAEAATPAVSEAVIKFRSCRWRRPPDDGVECCGHRDVLPIAGTTSFDAEAWCPDCKFFKLRRTPKKRDDYRY